MCLSRRYLSYMFSHAFLFFTLH
uniref:Uncharacterized protein n=1 Tax=Arundo donax TaxID=35708 RepID=A0A0A8YFV2_ARUDO